MKNIKVVIIIEIIFIIILYFFVESGFTNFIPQCFWYENFGILCPSCGGTRCIISFFNWDFYNSFMYNPVFFLTIIYIIILNLVTIIYLITKKSYLKCIYPKNWYLVIFAVVLLVFTLIRNML